MAAGPRLGLAPGGLDRPCDCPSLGGDGRGSKPVGLQLEPLPGCAPELHLDEGLGHYLKHVELRNLCGADLAELRLDLGCAVKRLRHQRHVLRGCIAECGYSDRSRPEIALLATPKSRGRSTNLPQAA